MASCALSLSRRGAQVFLNSIGFSHSERILRDLEQRCSHLCSECLLVPASTVFIFRAGGTSVRLPVLTKYYVIHRQCTRLGFGFGTAPFCLINIILEFAEHTAIGFVKKVPQEHGSTITVTWLKNRRSWLLRPADQLVTCVQLVTFVVPSR